VPEHVGHPPRPSRGLLVGLLAGAVIGLGGCGGGGPPALRLTVVAGGLANPRQLSVGADGSVYVAEAGDGGQLRCTEDPETSQPICLGRTGAIARVAGGRVTTVVGGLPSVAATDGGQASGPADVVAAAGDQLAFVLQDTRIDAAGANRFGPGARPLGHLAFASASAGGGAVRLGADLARYEATHDPDRGAGATAATRIESDPYGLVAYRGGYAVADAAGNDLLFVDAAGRVHLLAVFPPRSAGAAAKPVVAQSVPTSVAVGPDGALYVGELTGYPFAPGSARVWRVAPGARPTVYATGFTTISALAFDHAGRLLVLEIDRNGLNDTRGAGELIRLGADRPDTRTVLARRGLVYPTGLAVGADDSIYVSNYGSAPSTGAGPHGQILRLGPT
jgi:streptogramin lyase